jgi:hypothetical protein
MNVRILITGVTARMVGSTRLRYNYLSNVSLIEKALRLAGHQVDVRKVPLHEQNVTSQYDVALVGIASPFSLGAGQFPEAMKVLMSFGKKAALYADDWSIVGAGETIRGCVKGFDQWLKWRNFAHTNEQDEARTKLALMSIGDVQGCGWPMMVPMFGWGDKVKFMEDNFMLNEDQICAFDPTTLYNMPQFIPAEPDEKSTQWIMAALGKHDVWLKKLGLRWPVVSYGNKRQEQQVLTEDQVIQVYAENWGVLAAKYPKAGTGWWRVRYIHAAEVGSILLCDPEDGYHIGPSYCTLPEVIEKSSDDALAELAAKQKEELYSHSESVPDVVAKLDAFVKGLL